MEFHEKLQELRKNKGLTQEELAEILYVSRTAISKWESGRGYPSIDSLKNIANYFLVSIDDLLSGERLISIAEKENESNIRNICELLFGIVDICTFLLVALPLYPNTKDGYVYSVNLLAYEDVSVLNRLVYWSVFLVLIAAGVVKFSLTQLKVEKGQNIITACSLGIGILSVLYLGMAREAYAVTVAFLLLIIKGVLLLKRRK